MRFVWYDSKGKGWIVTDAKMFVCDGEIYISGTVGFHRTNPVQISLPCEEILEVFLDILKERFRN